MSPLLFIAFFSVFAIPTLAIPQIERVDVHYRLFGGERLENSQDAPITVETLSGHSSRRVNDNNDVARGDGASPMKVSLKGPSDLGIYFINSPGVSCGGLKTAQCSTSCSALGYPVYWCYPKVCYCHYGNTMSIGEDSQENEID